MTLYAKLFFTFFQIGLFSIGGGYAVIPLIQQEIVEKASWISQKAFTDILTISQMTPGPLAVNASTFVGLQTAGPVGAVLATTGCILAGVCISAGLYRFFLRHENSRRLTAVLSGLKSASLGLIVSAAASILLLAFTGESSLTLLDFGKMDWLAVVLFAASFWLLRKRKVNPILVMTLSGVAGGLLYL